MREETKIETQYPRTYQGQQRRKPTLGSSHADQQDPKDRKRNSNQDPRARLKRRRNLLYGYSETYGRVPYYKRFPPPFFKTCGSEKSGGLEDREDGPFLEDFPLDLLSSRLEDPEGTAVPDPEGRDLSSPKDTTA